MKARPILFSTPMVRALLEGRKTQTRRPVNARYLPIVEECLAVNGKWVFTTMDYDLTTPYGHPGDLLWVRESYGRLNDGAILYPATYDMAQRPHLKWKPSIHMPSAVSRLTLEITGVRVEKLRAISEADAIAEGFSCEDAFHDYWFEINPIVGECYQGDAQDNPWVWVIEFKVHKQNIDQFLKAKGGRI